MKLHLRLTLDVEYEVDTPDVESYLRDRLDYIPTLAAGEGLLTGNLDAEVETWTCKVEAVPDELLEALGSLE